MPFDLATAKPMQTGGFDLKSAKPVQQDDYEPLYQKYVSEYNATKNQVPIPEAQPVDQGPLLSKEDWKKRNDARFKNNLIGIPVAAGEQAANLAGGFAGMFAAPVVAGVKALNDVSQGRETSFEKDYANLLGEASSIGTKAVDATGFNSGSREAVNQGVGNVMNRVGIPMGGLNLPHFNKNAALREAMPELRMAESAKTNPILSSLDKPTETPPVPEQAPKFDLNSAKPMSPSQLKEWADIQERYAQYKRGELPSQRQDAAQAALEARQRALEQDVARQGGLDFNAAERARQEAAPTGYAENVEQLRQSANERIPGNNEPLDLGPATLRSAKNYPDVNDYPNLLQEKPYQYEGGVDYTPPMDKAALPVEIADMLRTGDKIPDPFDRVSPMQTAKRMLEGSELARKRPGQVVPRKGGKQSGAIDVKGIQEATRKWRDGLTDDMSLLKSFKGAFHPQEISDLVKSINGDTPDMHVVWMSPDQFRQLASQRSPTELAAAPKYHTPIKEALKSDSGLDATPHLIIREKDGMLQVDGHDGRHRMDMMKANGIEKVPVRVLGDSLPKTAFKVVPEDGGLTQAIAPAIQSTRFTPRGQSGKLDFKGIQEEGKKLTRALSEFGTKAIDVLTPAERVALNALGDNSYIPKGSSPESIVAKALQDADATVRFPNLQSGLDQAGKKFKSAIMTETARWISWAEKIGNKEFRERIKPVERSFAILSREDLVTAHGIFQREMFNRRMYTPEELAAHGASEKVIQAYTKLRTEFDNAFNAQNEGRTKLGLDPITKQAAYYASSWTGNYHMPVYDKNGALKWYVKTETRSEANKAMAWIKKNVPEADVAKMKVEYKPENVGANLPRDIGSTIQTMMSIFKDTPLEAEMKAMLEQHMTESAFNERGHNVHFEEKANIRGFLGDRPWLNEHQNAKMGIEAQVRYLREAHRWAPMQEAMANIKEVLSSPELLEKQPNNVAFTKLYVANALGVSKNLMKGLESYVAQGMGISPMTIGKFTGDLKNFTYLQLLGLSGGYAVATPLQALILGPSRHGLLSQAGMKYNPLKTMVNSLLDMGLLMGTHEMYNLTGKDMRSKLSPTGREALRYMEDNGIINMTLFDEYAALGEHKGWGLLKNTVGATISLPEKIARTTTFMSFVHHLKDGGMPLGQELFRLADEHTQATLTNFNRSARPLLVDKFGVTGELMYTFKSPLFNTYNSLFEFSKHAQRTGDYKPLVTALFMMGALGGAMSLPLMEELDGGVELLKSFVAKHKPELYDSLRGISIKGAMLKNLPDWATYGTVSNVSNVQMQSRFSNQIMDPNNPLGNVAPVLQELKEWGAAGNAALNPNLTSVQEGLWQNAPPAVKGLMETGLDNFKSFKKGNKQGYYNPNKLGEREAYVDRTPGDERARKFGVTTLREARQRDVRYIGNREDKRLSDARDASMDKMFDAVIRGADKDVITKYAKTYFALEGDSDQFQKDLDKKIAHAALTPEQRKAVYAKTLADAMSIKRQMDMSIQP